MKKKSPKTIFNISIAEFYTFAMAKLNFMFRDLAEFIKFGVTEEKLNALRALLGLYQDIPTDKELLGDQINATQTKDDLAEEVRIATAGIMTRVENKYGFDSGTYRKFGAQGISKQYGGTLSMTAKQVYRVALMYLTELESEGLEATMLEQFHTLIKDYDQALAAQSDAIADREIATENRVEKGNEIYRLLVKYCDTGKRIWESTNEAKYNDYVIYDTPSGNPPGPTASN